MELTGTVAKVERGALAGLESLTNPASARGAGQSAILTGTLAAVGGGPTVNVQVEVRATETRESEEFILGGQYTVTIEEVES